MKELILGIDQSLTCTGLVVLDRQGNLITQLTVRTAKSKNADAMELYDRIQTICNAIRELFRIYKITTVVIEGLSFGASGRATRDLAGLQCVIIHTLRNMSRPQVTDIRIVTPSALKKSATGRGTASKDEMLEAIPEALKSTFKSYPKTGGRYDLADAYHLARCALQSVDYVVPTQHVQNFKPLNIKD